MRLKAFLIFVASISILYLYAKTIKLASLINSWLLLYINTNF